VRLSTLVSSSTRSSAAEQCSSTPTAALSPPPPRFKLYTKTGDGGTAALYNGERRPKEDQTFAALGDVDELNSALGAAREFLSDALHGELPQQVRAVRRMHVLAAVTAPVWCASRAPRPAGRCVWRSRGGSKKRVLCRGVAAGCASCLELLTTTRAGA